tara:strand:+ start:133 stop:318 length:186 start_codon:yes stop_codon:yes gene_type:complete
MQQWEYKIVWKNYKQIEQNPESLDNPIIDKLSVEGLNELGLEGWEMVSATVKKIYFKRPLN